MLNICNTYCIEYEYTIHHEEQSLCIDGSINKKSHELEKIKYCKKADYNQKWRLSVDSNGFHPNVVNVEVVNKIYNVKSNQLHKLK